jgi:uncharacterized RDD family membrane protein YckC
VTRQSLIGNRIEWFGVLLINGAFMNFEAIRPVLYPRLIRRVRAILVDSIVLPIVVLGVVMVGSAVGVSNGYAKFALLVIPMFFLEPVMVAVTGGTIGHHLLGVRIATLDGQRNINIFAATLRFAIKVLLGWFSMIFILTTKRHQAFHDLLARSVVIHKSPSALPAYEILAERGSSGAEYSYPPAWRRVLVIFGYWVVATMVVLVVSGVAVSIDCIESQFCSKWEHLFLLGLNLIWLVSLGGALVWGWQGRLFGCRRRPR